MSLQTLLGLSVGAVGQYMSTLKGAELKEFKKLLKQVGTI
jgi:predicted transcriptional regulator